MPTPTEESTVFSSQLNLLLKQVYPIPVSEACRSSSPEPLTESIAVFKIRLIDFPGSCFPLSQNSCAKLIHTYRIKATSAFSFTCNECNFFSSAKIFVHQNGVLCLVNYSF